MAMLVFSLMGTAMPAAFAAPAKAEPAGAGQEVQWEKVKGVKVEVDGIDSGKTVDFDSGSVDELTSDVLPKDFPHRDKLQLQEVFVDIDGQRFAVDFVGSRDKKIYYALKGADTSESMLITSVVDAPKTVILSFQDTSEPLDISVQVGDGKVKKEDVFSVIGLTDQELVAQGGTSSGSFKMTAGSTRTFVVDKQVAQKIEVKSQGGKVEKVSGDDQNDASQVWKYTAPKDGKSDKITVTAKGMKRDFRVTASMVMPDETPGGGDGKPGTNRMYGNAEIAGYLLADGSFPTVWDKGGENDFVEYSQYILGVPDVQLSNTKKLSVSDRKFLHGRGENYHDGDTFFQKVTVSGGLDGSYDRTKDNGPTVLIDMASTRCTPGDQGWATQMSGITVNGVALPLNGFDFTTVGGPNSGDHLKEKVSDWITLDGKAKGTRARVVALGSWSYGKHHLNTMRWEFHHYIVELRDVNGPVDVKALYTTTANYRVIDLQEYGVDAQIYRKEEGTDRRYWEPLSVGGTLQIKNMVTTEGRSDASDIRVFADGGYTLQGVDVKQVNDNGEVVVVPLKKTESVGSEKRKANVYEIKAPSSKVKMGYSYFYMDGTLVDYDVSYDPNEGMYADNPIDDRPYNVEALSSLTVDPQRPTKVDDEGTWAFDGYSLYDGKPSEGAQALKSKIQPGDSVDLSKVTLGASDTDKRSLVLQADWQPPASKGTVVETKVNFDLYNPYGGKEGTVAREILLAKNTDYEFVRLPDRFDEAGHTYHLNKEKSSLDKGKATANGQVIGTAVYERKDADKPGTLDGSKYLHGKKVVKGEGAPVLAKGQFEFKLTALVADAPMPKEGATTTNEADGTFKFGNIEFTKPGTYLYEISEVDKKAEHWTYDTHALRVTVTAMPPAKPGEALEVTATAEESARTFTNTYDKPKPQAVTLDGKTYLDGTKTLTGEGAPELQSNQFQFTISSVSAPAGVTAPMPQQHSVLNDATGRFYFDDIVFNAPGTYVYEIAEDAEADPQFIYDGTRHKVTVTVTEPTTPGGMYGLAVEGPDSLDFVNTFVKAPDFRPGVLEAGSIAGVKVLNGAELDAGDFGFKIAAQNGAPLPTRTVERNAYDGDYAFGSIVFTKPGTYVYTVSEVNEGMEGYTYDDHAATVTVEVTDDPAQQDEPLTCKVVKVDGSLEFVNTYAEPAPDPGVLKGVAGAVILTGEGAPALQGGEFRFTMLPAAAPDGVQAPVPAEAVNGADGSFAFGDLSFDAPGVYEYRVTQVEGRDPRVTYDMHEAVVTVTVAKPASAQSVDAAAKPSYTVDAVVTGSLEFENRFTLPEPPAPPVDPNPPVEPETPEQPQAPEEPQAPEAAPEQPVAPEQQSAAPDAKPVEGAITQTNDAFALVVPVLAALAAMSLAAGLVALLLCSGRGRMRR